MLDQSCPRCLLQCPICLFHVYCHYAVLIHSDFLHAVQVHFPFQEMRLYLQIIVTAFVAFEPRSVFFF